MAWSRRPTDWMQQEREWRPLATWWLLGIIVGVYVLQLLVFEYVNAQAQAFVAGTAPFPGIVWPGPHGDLVHDWHSFLFVIGTDWLFRPWTLVTSTLSHAPGDPTHLLFNGLFLFFFGPSVERLIGRKRYVTLFLVAGALAGIVQVHAVSWLQFGAVFHPDPGALGASGALMLLMGILMILTPKTQIFMMFLPVPLWIGGIIYALLDVLGAINPDPLNRVGNFAHLSGMALGLAYGWWTKQEFKRRGVRVEYG